MDSSRDRDAAAASASASAPSSAFDSLAALEAAAAKHPTEITREDEKKDEYKETWLKMWNNTTNPKEVSCRVAFDIVYWCFGPVNQVRSLYRTGEPTMCDQQWSDFKLCLKVKAEAMKDPEDARSMLREAREAQMDRRPHIWKFRTQPPKQFRAPPQQTEPDLTSTEPQNQ